MSITIFVLAITFLAPALGIVFNGQVWIMGFVFTIIVFVLGYSLKPKANVKSQTINKMRKMFLLIICLSFYYSLSAQETTLFDKNGEATCYVQNSTAVLFSFSGNALAFFKLNADNSLSVYNFYGKHIGWYEGGIFRDNEGNTIVFKKGSIIHSTNYEPYKDVKKIIPVKPYAEIPPYKPYYSNTFSNISTDYLFYNFGNVTSKTNAYPSNPNAPYNHPYTNDDFVPTPLYRPNFSAIEEVLSIGQQQYYEQQRKIKILESNGYLYDAETNKYLSPDQWKKEKDIRQYSISNALELFVRNPLYTQEKPIKNGKYFAFYMSATHSNPMIYSGTVKVFNHKLVSMQGEGHKRKFKNGTKILKGLCSADIFDKFGFWENTMTYPGYLFFLMPLKK